MEINITHDLSKLSLKLTGRMSERNMRFAVVKSASELALSGRNAVQGQMGQHFTLRRSWVVKGIRAQTATMSTGEAYVYSKDTSVGSGSNDRNFMTRQEAGGLKVKTKHQIAVPLNGVRPTKSMLIPAIFKPKALLGGGVPVTIRRAGQVRREYLVTARGFKTMIVNSKKRPGDRVLLVKRAGDGERFKPWWVLKDATKVKPTHFLTTPMAAHLDAEAPRVLTKNIVGVLFEERFGSKPPS